MFLEDQNHTESFNSENKSCGDQAQELTITFKVLHRPGQV